MLVGFIVTALPILILALYVLIKPRKPTEYHSGFKRFVASSKVTDFEPSRREVRSLLKSASHLARNKAMYESTKKDNLLTPK